MHREELLDFSARNSLVLNVAGQAVDRLGATHFGGRPDLPPAFPWPTFHGKGPLDEKAATRPLAFLAQFDCRELAAFDQEHLLPAQGLLSFFYELDTQPWGFQPADKGGARVFYFEESANLEKAAFPEELENSYRLPAINIGIEKEISLPEWEDFSKIHPTVSEKQLEKAKRKGNVPERENCSKLLGWPNSLQSSMFAECELVTQGYYLGGDRSGIPKEILRQAEETAVDRWQLLFQLDTVRNGEFELLFGDCGRIYFFIPRQDLAARRFERVWLILQCC